MTDPRIKAAVARLGLSARESEVVERIAVGQHTKQVAKELYIEVLTVRTHLRRIFGKLEINSQRELISRVLVTVLDDTTGGANLAAAGSAAVGGECLIGDRRPGDG